MSARIESIAVRSDCPNTYLAATTDVLNRLRPYVEDYYSGRTAASPAGVRVAQHVAKKETWLEIRTEDRTLSDALALCLAIPNVGRDELLRLGIDGAIRPSINYSPSFGFYRLQ